MNLEELKSKTFLDVNDIATACDVSKSKAYLIIRALNDKLINKGIPREAIIAGKISSKFFFESYNL